MLSVKKKKIVEELEELPEGLSSQVLSFIRFLKYSQKKTEFDTAMVSEPSLAKDWNSQEEDVAWNDL